MNKEKMKDHGPFGNHNFYGTITVGERAQIVIPHEARTNLGIEPGDKLVVFGHGKMVHLMKANELNAFLDKMTKKFTNSIEEMKKKVKKEN